MSASPTTAANTQSQKRPLEDPSPDSSPSDQPEAKRQALHKTEAVNGQTTTDANVQVDSNGTTTEKQETNDFIPLNPGKNEATNGVTYDNNVSDRATLANTRVDSPKPIPTTTSSSGISQPTLPISQQQDETGWLHIRAVISSAEAATVIGKRGENVTEIRRLSGAKCTVSDYVRGAVERILTVSGMVDAIAKAFGLIIRTLNEEPMQQASDSHSKTYPLRLLIPYLLIGPIIGQKGARIREIQEASGARLNASDNCLPLSNERSLVVVGVADAVHIATYYVGTTLVEQLTERFGGPAASAYATRGGSTAGVVPGGMQVIPYSPQAAGGQWGHTNNYNRRNPQQSQPQQGSYSQQYQQNPGQAQYQQQGNQNGMHYGGSQPRGSGYQGAGPQVPQQGYGQQQMQPQGQAQPQQYGAQGQQHFPGQPLTQQIYIPNDMVGAIIGKGGAKINEIRQLSGSVIKINEPQDNSNERLVTITGTQDCNQMALYMLYSRLGKHFIMNTFSWRILIGITESEKHRI